jgi:hypothetical protein
LVTTPTSSKKNSIDKTASFESWKEYTINMELNSLRDLLLTSECKSEEMLSEDPLLPSGKEWDSIFEWLSIQRNNPRSEERRRKFIAAIESSALKSLEWNRKHDKGVSGDSGVFVDDMVDGMLFVS